VYLLSISVLFALQATPGHIWLIMDAGGRTVDVAMHRIEEGATPGHFQLPELLHATCLLQGSTRLDQQAKQLLLSLFVVHLRRLSAGSRRTHIHQPGEVTLDIPDLVNAQPERQSSKLSPAEREWLNLALVCCASCHLQAGLRLAMCAAAQHVLIA
jgi:hypothetical protein